jgi:hypothetical protein
VEPAIKYVENSKQARLWARCAAFYFRFQPTAGPYGLSPIKKRNRKLNFRLEVGVEAGFRATGFRKDGIDTNLTNTIPRKQFISSAY